MRKLLAAAVLAISISGCVCQGHMAFIEGTDAFSRQVLPEYRRYVADDKGLDDASKAIRLRTADEFQKLIDEAKSGE